MSNDLEGTPFGPAAFILEARDLPTGYHWINQMPPSKGKLIEASYNSLGRFHAIVAGTKEDLLHIQRSLLSGGAHSELICSTLIEAIHPDVLKAYFALLKNKNLKYTAVAQFESVCRAFEVAQKVAENKDLKLVDFRGCKGNSFRPHLVVTSDKPESQKVILGFSDGDTNSTWRWLGEVSPMLSEYVR